MNVVIILISNGAARAQPDNFSTPIHLSRIKAYPVGVNILSLHFMLEYQSVRAGTTDVGRSKNLVVTVPDAQPYFRSPIILHLHRPAELHLKGYGFVISISIQVFRKGKSNFLNVDLAVNLVVVAPVTPQ